MKGFFPILLVVCALLAGAWFAYDPYLKPLLDRFRGEKSMTANDRVIPGSKEPGSVASPPPVAQRPAAKPASPATGTPGGTKAASTPVAPAPTKPKTELDVALEMKYPMPEILPLLAIVDQWRNVPPNAYPSEVTASETIPFALVINGQTVGSSNVSPGTPLKPVRLEGDQLLVASLANPAMNTRLHVDKTDFKQRIEARYRQFVETKQKEVMAKRERARQIITADPSKLAMLTGKGGTAVAAGDDGDPRFAPVKASLRNGEAASVTIEEARTFQWNGSEKVGGEYAGTYETVTVHFEVATIFGRFPVDYKALLRNGRVHAWIDPVTEDRI